MGMGGFCAGPYNFTFIFVRLRPRTAKAFLQHVLEYRRAVQSVVFAVQRLSKPNAVSKHKNFNRKTKAYKTHSHNADRIFVF